MSAPAHPTVEQRRQLGEAARARVPVADQARWSPDGKRADPVQLLEEQCKNRLQWLVPVRRGRMMASQFAFFRGAARVMAADLATTPVSGLTVQACGDAHLSNFGFYASPERQLVFDVNDFDETLAGPWEWDLKRLTASFMIAARHNGLDADQCRKTTAHAVHAYRKAMGEYSAMRTTDVWYTMVKSDSIERDAKHKGADNEIDKTIDQSLTKDNQQAFDKLTEQVDGACRIRSEPPVLVPLRELRDELQLHGRNLQALALRSFDDYQNSLPDHVRFLLSRFRPVELALRVVGVGSVATRCLLLLLEGRDNDDPLFLQIKEATTSVLAEHLPASPYKNQGQRVVEGQHLMQTASDSFLGWVPGGKGSGDYYWRQFRDWKGSVDIDGESADGLHYYARLCGTTLARAHARSGDPVAIAAYLGPDDEIDQAMTDFAASYADQNQSDHAEFVKQIESGALAVEQE